MLADCHQLTASTTYFNLAPYGLSLEADRVGLPL